MKYIILFSIVCLVSCENKKPKASKSGGNVVIAELQFPRFVKSKCGQWAVQIKQNEANYDHLKRARYLGFPDASPLMDVKGLEFLRYTDASLGNEFQYPDSLTAVKEYKRYKFRIDSFWSHAEAIRKSYDSIYKCQHTYE